MFENISFLFLFAMALISWAVLCLQHLVEVQKRAASNYHEEFYRERPEIAFEPRMSHKPSDPIAVRGVFNFTLSFWVILAVTFGLSKLLQLIERQAKNYLKNLKALQPVNAVECRSLTEYPVAEENQPTPDSVAVEENAALREQLSVLETHCLEMREIMHELRLSKSSTSQSEDEGVVSLNHSEESLMIGKRMSYMAMSPSTHSLPLINCSSQPGQNIYITNSHIHIRGPVFCSENRFNLELSRQASMYARKQSEFIQVFGKYITGSKERPMIAGSMRCNNILM
ncbi:uncharacterized protein LOC110185920 [Drosophila serrata]|uniref:uncharacterized protein LOC110185920 n=1 Tax=Drosophila serrata TaxID=7274 RepID=UPI000A1CFA87|nr:uncharacterized protein LOC110185920 [Drosophila serrata]